MWYSFPALLIIIINILLSRRRHRLITKRGSVQRPSLLEIFQQLCRIWWWKGYTNVGFIIVTSCLVPFHCDLLSLWRKSRGRPGAYCQREPLVCSVWLKQPDNRDWNIIPLKSRGKPVKTESRREETWAQRKLRGTGEIFVLRVPACLFFCACVVIELRNVIRFQSATSDSVDSVSSF